MIVQYRTNDNFVAPIQQIKVDHASKKSNQAKESNKEYKDDDYGDYYYYQDSKVSSIFFSKLAMCFY